MRMTRPLSVVLAALVLIGGANLAAYAATGGKFILGHVNKAGRSTTLTNTGPGPALQLNSRAGSPALSVPNENKIDRLNADKVDGLDSSAFAPAGHDHDERYYLEHEVDHMFASQRFIETGNGVGNNYGCLTGLGVQITDGRGNAANDRFTFQVPGPSAQAWGQIRSDGSIRTSSSNVASVSQLETGVYCIQFSGGGLDLEGTVVSMHLN